MTPIVIVFLTYARTEYALRAIGALRAHLRYDDRAWYVADDGSEAGHVAEVYQLLELLGERVIGGHSERIGYGASANRAWRAALDHSAFSLWLEDDWVLERDLDLTPYVALLENHHDVGIVRLAYLPVGLRCESIGYDGRHYLDILKERQYAFSGNPSLRHRRFWEHFGEYPTGRNPGDTEIAYDEHFRETPGGPRIVWPVDLGGWGIFGHIGEKKSYTP